MAASSRLLACLIAFALAGHSATAEEDLRLLNAVKKQDAAAVRALLRQKVDVDARQGDGATALHWAAYGEDQDIVALLVRAGAKVNVANELGVTPLHLASRNGNATIVRQLLDARANPNTAMPSGESPLMEAARAGSIEAVKALIARGADVNARESTQDQTALMWAVAARQSDVARTLVESGADIKARSKVVRRLVYTGFRYITAPPSESSNTVVEIPDGGFTALLFAAQQGSVESLQLLLDHGADVNDTAPIGTSALTVAAYSGQRAAVDLLLERGANPNHDSAGYTPLHTAVLRGDAAMVRSLLARGAKPNVVMTKGSPVRKYGQEYALTLSWKGATPFWLAARFAEPEILRALASAGADPKQPTADGTPPLLATVPPRGQGDRRERYQTDAEAAAVPRDQDERDTVAAVDAILDMGLDINTQDAAGDTLVHLVALKGWNAAIQHLVDHGATLDVQNKRGLTPLAALTSARRPPGDPQAAAKPNPTVEFLKTLGAK